MFKTVIWATDGSEWADQALPYVKSLALDSDSAVVVVHVDEQLLGRTGGSQPLIADENDLRTKIERQVHGLGDAGVNARLQVVKPARGGAAHQISDIAAELPADMIIVGTRGHSALGGVFVGSVTQRLLHLAPCPVLAVTAESTPVEAR
jgi:nucleotide-binding universal stress UspA family protein